MGCKVNKEATEPNATNAPEKHPDDKKADEKAAAPPPKIESTPPQNNPPPSGNKEPDPPPPADVPIEIDLSACTQDIPATLQNSSKLKEATVLKLSSNSLDQLPDAVTQMSSLTELYLSENRFNSLASVVQRAPQVVTLDCSDNPITTFEGIGALKKLENLAAYKLHLMALPDEIFTLTSLEDLNLFNNSLKRVPVELNKLTELRQLNLASNKLNQLVPNSLNGMKHLKRLALFWNRIVKLPNLADLVELETLQLQGNLIQEWPQLDKHPCLKEINLTKNEISSLPAAAFSPQTFPELRELEINSNKLESLPDSLATLPNLTKLSISENKLTSLPDGVWGMKGLTFLGLQQNKFTEIPATITGLKDTLLTLYVEGNQLTSLPGCLTELGELVRFSAKNNPLEDSAELKGTLDKLKTIVNENGSKPDKGGAKFIV